MSGILFFIFASCELLMSREISYLGYRFNTLCGLAFYTFHVGLTNSRFQCYLGHCDTRGLYINKCKSCVNMIVLNLLKETSHLTKLHIAEQIQGFQIKYK